MPTTFASAHSNINTTHLPLFRLGQLLATPAALALAQTHNIDIRELVKRHCCGDDGDVDAEDKKRNAYAITHGARVFSSYRVTTTLHTGDASIDDATVARIWVITEADRRSTTVLLPGDY